MDAMLLDTLHRYAFVLLATGAAMWITWRIGRMIGDAIVTLVDLFVKQD